LWERSRAASVARSTGGGDVKQKPMSIYEILMREQMYLDKIDRLLERVFDKAVKKAWLEGDRAAFLEYSQLLNEVRGDGVERKPNHDRH